MSDRLIIAVARKEELAVELEKAKEKLPEWEKYRSATLRVMKLMEECTHLGSYTDIYQWHHGYGKYIDGRYCRFCKKYKAWATMGNWSHDEV